MMTRLDQQSTAAAAEGKKNGDHTQFDIHFRLSAERTSGRMHFYKNL